MTSFYGVPASRCMARYGSMLFPSKDQVIGRSLALYGEWGEHEIETVSSFLRDGPGIVDVGANIGTHSMAFASRFPTSTVYAFEPQPFSFMLLAANIAQNAFDKVQIYNIGCAATLSTLKTAFDYKQIDDNHGSLSLDAVATESNIATPLAMGALDDILGDRDIQLVKVDVEGQELAVIQGMTQILSRQRPIVYVEVLELERLSPIRAILLQHGYDLRWLETSAFNENNYNGVAENIWDHCEIGVLAFPDQSSKHDNLPCVTGEEKETPRFHDPLFRYQGKSFAPAAVERRRANDAIEEGARLRAKVDGLREDADTAGAKVATLLAEQASVERAHQEALALLSSTNAETTAAFDAAVAQLGTSTNLLSVETDATRSLLDEVRSAYRDLVNRASELRHQDHNYSAGLKTELGFLKAQHDESRKRNDQLSQQVSDQAQTFSEVERQLAMARDGLLQATAAAESAASARREAMELAMMQAAELATVKERLASAEHINGEVRAELLRYAKSAAWRRVVGALLPLLRLGK